MNLDTNSAIIAGLFLMLMVLAFLAGRLSGLLKEARRELQECKRISQDCKKSLHISQDCKSPKQ